jgi:Tol biopolymer transport system component
VLALGVAGALALGALDDDEGPAPTAAEQEEGEGPTEEEPQGPSRTTLVSTGADDEPLEEPVGEVSSSDDGRVIAFVTAGEAFGLDTGGDVANVFVVDERTGEGRLVSEGRDGAAANGPSSDPVMSPGGEAVAFVSEASNLVPDDTNDRPDIFLRRGDEPIQRVSVGAEGQQGSGTASQPDLSEDGKVAFVSTSANLVAPQDLDGGLEDVFVRDLVEDATVRLSGEIEFAAAPAISANGRYVTFFSSSDATVPGEDNGVGDIFRRDLETDEIQRITQSSDGAQQNASARQTRTSDLSADGRYVVFASPASNLVQGDDNGVTDVFVRDAEDGSTTRVSISNDRRGGDGDSLAPTISRSGSFIAFRSAAENLLLAGDRSVGAGDAPRVFLHARQTRTTSLVDVGTGGPSPEDSDAAGATAPATVSSDGNRVIFTAPIAGGDGVTGVFSRLVEPAQTMLDAPRSTPDPRPVVRLTSDDPAVDRFLCQIDGGIPFACGPGETRLPALEPGDHRIAARAGGPGLRWDPSAAGASITVRQGPTGG